MPVRVLTAREKELNKDSVENVRLRHLKRERIEEERKIVPVIRVKLLKIGGENKVQSTGQGNW